MMLCTTIFTQLSTVRLEYQRPAQHHQCLEVVHFRKDALQPQKHYNLTLQDWRTSTLQPRYNAPH